MNFYMLVEGKSTEMAVYPRIIRHYRPEYTQVFLLDDIRENNFFLVSGMGIPSLYDRIAPSIEDIREHNRMSEYKIDSLVIVLDADIYGSVEATYEKVVRELQKANIDNIQWEIIVQNKCIETWFLGNCEAYPEAYSDAFAPFADHYNVSQQDPEQMSGDGEHSIGTYSKIYLKKMLNETKRTYTERRVKDVTTPEYFEGMNSRILEAEDVASYKAFVDWLQTI